MQKKLICFFFLIFSLSFVMPGLTIDYFGVASKDLDSNMASMTSDLYYTQLCEIKTLNVTDSRFLSNEPEMPDTSKFNTYFPSIYTVIEKNEDSGKWTATIHIVNLKPNEIIYTKEYDSYYKILMESKTSIQETFISLIEGTAQNNETSDRDFQAVTFQDSASKEAVPSTETIAGTWSGEKNIDKVVIMRGGRGFVIFKNGASMNISVQLNKNIVKISQTGKTNASFFPELPRQTAMEVALNAKPIFWEMELTSTNEMKGKKTTILPDGDNTKLGEIQVSWFKQER